MDAQTQQDRPKKAIVAVDLEAAELVLCEHPTDFQGGLPLGSHSRLMRDVIAAALGVTPSALGKR